MFTRRSSLRTARLLLGVFLVAQAGLAMAGCDWGARDAARAVVLAAGSGEAPCHEVAAPSAGPGLCLTHCLGSLQSLDKPMTGLPPQAAIAVLTVPPPAARTVLGRQPLLATAAPPPRILFQSFLI